MTDETNPDAAPEDDLGAAVRRSFTDESGMFAFTELHGARYRLVLELRDGFADSTPLRARARLSPAEFVWTIRSFDC